MLTQRVASAAVLIPVVAVAAYLGGYCLFLLVMAAALLALWEYVQLAREAGTAPNAALALTFTALLVARAQWPDLIPISLVAALLVAVSLVYEVLRGNRPGALNGWALGVAGASYVGGMSGHLLSLRALPQGREWLAVALVCTWVCDTGAYAVGRTLGQHRFFASISPKKTWEGAAGGLASGLLAAVGLGRWLLGIDLAAGLALGVVVVLAATFGDLAESLIKRQAGVKDSGNVIPGHGGMLDRIDSLLFVVPAVYYYALYIVPLL